MQENKMYNDIEFSDETILRNEASFLNIESDMKKEDVYASKWMISSDASVKSYSNGVQISESFMKLQFYYNKEAVITECLSSVKDMYTNPDIRGLIELLRLKGWEKVSVHPFLIDENRNFWRFFWESGLIDSDYLDKKIGRENIEQVGDNNDNGDDNDNG